MTLIYSGKKRSLTVSVFKNGLEVTGSPYDGRMLFVWNNVTYASITTTQLSVLSQANYATRLAVFQAYVQSLNTGLNFSTDVDSPNYINLLADATCVTPPTTTTTTAPPTTTTTTLFTVTPPSVKVLMNISADNPLDFVITQIQFRGINTLVSAISGDTREFQYPMPPLSGGNGILVVSVEGNYPIVGGFIRVTDSMGSIYTKDYTGTGSYTFSYPLIAIDGFTQAKAEFNATEAPATTTTTTTVGPTTTTTTYSGPATTTTTTLEPTTTTTTTTTTTEAPIYYNEEQYGDFTKQCPSGYEGSSLRYTVNANTYWSYVSVAAANLQAIADVNENGQAYVNASLDAYCYDPTPPPPDPCYGNILTSLLSVSRTSLSTANVTATPRVITGTPSYMRIQVAVQNGGGWDAIYDENHLFTNNTPVTISVTGLDNSHTYIAGVSVYVTSPGCSGGYIDTIIPNYY